MVLPPGAALGGLNIERVASEQRDLFLEVDEAGHKGERVTGAELMVAGPTEGVGAPSERRRGQTAAMEPFEGALFGGAKRVGPSAAGQRATTRCGEGVPILDQLTIALQQAERLGHLGALVLVG
jgi:hypothetical protein